MSLEEKVIELTQEEHEIMLLMDKYPQIAMLLLINYVEIVVSMILGKGVYWYVKGKYIKMVNFNGTELYQTQLHQTVAFLPIQL